MTLNPMNLIYIVDLKTNEAALLRPWKRHEKNST